MDRLAVVTAAFLCVASAVPAFAGGSLTDTSIHRPAWPELWRLVTLHDYNTRVVVLGVTILGIAAGLVGTFMLLRKRALMGDALSHATLPGIGLAFIVMSAMGFSGRSLPGLLLGATLSGSLGIGGVLFIRRFSRLKEDAALGIVLSVSFGLGVAVLGIIQKMDTGNAAGLESFIYGKTASMLRSDATLIAGAAGVIVLACLVLFKEFAVLCFDQDFAGTQGWPLLALDAVMMALVVIVTVIGLQAVGLILMVALLVIPPAAARFWTNHLGTLLLISAAIGAVSGYFGAGLSAVLPRLPAGAIIVVVASFLFGISLLFGTARGVVLRWTRHLQLQNRITRQHLLRALFEDVEPQLDFVAPSSEAAVSASFETLRGKRSWSARALRRGLRSAVRDGFVQFDRRDGCRLTPAGFREARKVVRNHRLWELFLITHADIAPSHVDRDADQLEHVLAPDMVERLESLLAAQDLHEGVPASPHALPASRPGSETL